MPLKDILKHIDELQAQINSHGKLDGDILKKINYKFRLDWNYNSNVMEGNSLTKLETRTVMINNITVEGKPLKDVLEMRGHDNVISDILKIGKGEMNLSEKRILEIHKGIMYEDDPEKKQGIGIWKTDNNYLLNYKNERVDFTPYTEVKEKMHELMNWLSGQYEKIKAKEKGALHPVVLAFEFHLRYVTIHPFYDGNGRTSRIFTNLILIAFGYPPVIVKLEEKNPYYQYLADIQSYGGSPDLFYEFMCGLLIRSQEIVLKAIEGRDIDEPDDFDKKIAIFTKGLEEHKDAVKVKKSIQIQKELFDKFIHPFIMAINSKMGKLNHLFFDNYYLLPLPLLYRYDQTKRQTIDQVVNNIQEHIATKDFVDCAVIYAFKEFKRATNAFNIYIRISITMDSYKYKVSFIIDPLLAFNAATLKYEVNKATFKNYELYEEYFHNIPSTETITKLAIKLADDTFAYIEDKAAQNKA